MPRFLPCEKPGYVKQLKLMNKMLQSVFEVALIPNETMDFLKQFHRLHFTSEEHFQTVLKDQITTLDRDETFAMFVRRQNCTLMIHKQHDNSTILATFRGDMKSSDVYRYESDIEVRFPFWLEFEPQQNLPLHKQKSIKAFIRLHLDRPRLDSTEVTKNWPKTLRFSLIQIPIKLCEPMASEEQNRAH